MNHTLDGRGRSWYAVQRPSQGALPMESEPKQPERETTDASLRTERKKTDIELAASFGASKADAAEVVAETRDQADAVLNETRDREDQRLAARGTLDAKREALGHERARDDAALEAERDRADVIAEDEGDERQQALRSLLAFERQDTDLRLRLERTRADEALTSREEFLAIVSHDLRNLLGGVALSAQALTRLATVEVPGTEVARHAELIQRFSARMNRLIGDLMDVASIDAGKLSMLPKRHDAAGLIRDSIEAFESLAVARGVALTSELGHGNEAVECDHGRIMQVLANLVGNALKFTEKGGHVAIRLERHGNDVRFVVADTGEGIPGDRLEKIFERFYQTHRNDQRGLGLGLYIARSIVEAHGGKLWAESTLGRGSTFSFTLAASPAP